MSDIKKSMFLKGLRQITLAVTMAATPPLFAAEAEPEAEAEAEPAPVAIEPGARVGIAVAAVTEAAAQAEKMAAEYQADQHHVQKIAVIHVDTYDALRASGLDGAAAVRHLAVIQGLSLDNETLADVAEEVDGAAPHAFFIRNGTRNGQQPACLVVTSEPLAAFAIPDFTPEQMTRFINRHEFRHCADPLFGPHQEADRHIDYEKEQQRLQNGEFTPFILRQTLNVLRGETYADIAAMGDMIARDGDSPGIIDKLILFRQHMFGTSFDMTHYSKSGLTALKAEIDDMGVDAFRALPPESREEMYRHLALETLPSPVALRTFLEISVKKITPEQAEARAAGAGSAAGAEIRAGIALYHDSVAGSKMMMPPSPRFHAYIVMSHVEEENTREELLARARETDGRITPQSLTRARTHILNNLFQGLEQNPEDHVTAARSLQLREIYTNLMRSPETFAPAAPQAQPQRRAPHMPPNPS